MFTKLLKHEWRATRGMLGTLCLVCLGASLMGGATMRYLIWASTVQEMEQDVIVVLNVLGMVTAIIALAVTGVAALFLYIGRFYRSRFTDEGYLTFTLPVNTHQNLLSSLANTAIGMVIVCFVICAALGLWLAIGFTALPGFYETLWEVLPEVWAGICEELGKLESSAVFRGAALFLLNAVTGSACELVMLMLSVTVGSILAKKHKILAAIGVYYGINVVISMAGSATLAMQAFTTSGGAQMVLRVFTSSAVMTTAVAVAGYFLMYWLMDKKLNLN